GTAGHVDHGKSTLVHTLTGIDPDRFAEEKRRGLTIDLGFAWLPLPSGAEIGLVDVPGHERFIKNMLAGAGGISVCLFVVAANEGWMPQSSEHLSIVDLLGVSHGVVALTKADTVDDDTLKLARAEVEENIARSTLKGAPIVACSPVTGAGMDDLVAGIDDAVRAAPPAPDRGRARLWVDRVFTIAGAGTVVTGTLAGGSFFTGDDVEVVGVMGGRGRRARIRAIQSHKKEVRTIGPGNRTALNLAGLERHGAERGDAVVLPEKWRATSRIDVRLRVLEVHFTGREHELTDKGAHLLYVGSAETPVRVKLLGREKLTSGEVGYAQLLLRDPLPLQRGDRFVLRDAGRILTFGGGEVLDPLPSPARRTDADRVRLLDRLSDADAEGALVALVEAHEALPAREALIRAGAPGPVEGVIALGNLFLSKDRFEALGAAARAALKEHHAARPLERGMPREALRSATGLETGPFEALVDRLEDVVEEGAVVRLESFRVELAPEQQRARDELVKTIEAGGFQPPLAKDLEADAALLRALTESGELVKIADFYLTRGRAAEARATVRAHIQGSGPITVAEIRDLLGTSRKYAVPLCEWLDQTGATLRRGDERVLGPNP
ncbi:MAG: selenocysteine-specific translation elongation factor, partial [Actinomycetota bacterium]